MGKQLFEIIFRVRPNHDHPRFGEFKFGKLYIWLYAFDSENAYFRAVKFVETLPYEIGAGKSFPVDTQPPKALSPKEVNCAISAIEVGFYIAIQTWPMEADENEVLKNWPLLMPPLEPFRLI